MTEKFKESVIVLTPVYEDTEASNRLFIELSNTLNKKLEIVAVDDGSVREPLDIKNISKVGLSGVVLKLKRNVGHQRAIAIGLSYIADRLNSSQRVVIMDSDGEDLPSSINKLLTTLDSQEGVDVVVAQRKSRIETLRFRTFYIIYKLLFKLLAGRDISFGNFMVLKASAVKRLVTMHELWVHVAGSVLASKLRMEACSIDRGPRYAGQSKMNFVGLALHGFKGLMVFAEDVLVRVGIACIIVAFLSIMGGISAIILKIIGFATPGWFSVALGILFLVFLQTAALTLMTLMLTGVAKHGSIARFPYEDFIDNVLRANEASN